jgi:(2Fe-2S) ferredoxin
MPKPKVHFLVCTNQRQEGHPRGCCSTKGSLNTLNIFQQKLMASQKFDTVKVSAVRSCLGPCEKGPIVVVYPDDVWYGSVTAEAAEKIWDSHVNEGKPAQSFVMQAGTF